MGIAQLTPAYGMWLKNHLSLYEFRTQDAKVLQRRILQLDVTNTANLNEMNDLYLKFVSMFCNSMHCVGFECANNDITSIYPDAYLVLNEYGVMAPIRFMKENGKTAEYDMADSAASCLAQMKQAETNLAAKIQNDLLHKKEPMKSRDNAAAGPEKGIVVLFLVLTAIVGCITHLKTIVNDMKSWYLGIGWGCIAIILIAFTILSIVELLSFSNRQQLLKQVHHNQIPGAQTVINFEDYVHEYSAKLKTLQLTEFKRIPPASKTFLQIIEEKKHGIKQGCGNYNSAGNFKGYLGIFMIVVLLLINLFVYYGTEHWDYHRANDGQMQVEAQATVSDAAVTDTVNQVVTGYEAVQVQNVKASSELKELKSGKIYSGMNAADGDAKTCWQEGVEGDGIGETLTFELEKETAVAGFEIVNGNAFSRQKYWNNGRLNDFTLSCYGTDGDLIYEEKFQVNDKYNTQPVRIMFFDGEIAECASVKLTINGVKQGKKYKDTCLSELTLIEALYE